MQSATSSVVGSTVRYVFMNPGPDGVIVYSPSDIAKAACPLLLLRELDAKLGRAPALQEVVDPMNERAAMLGNAHEERVLANYRAEFGPFDPEARRGVAEIGTGGPIRDTLDTDRAATLDALRAGADVVFQATFFDGRFYGRADFLVKVADGGPASGEFPRYAVVDTKLTAKVRSTALLQLAGYADQLLDLEVPLDEDVWIHHGDGARTGHQLADLLAVFRRERLTIESLLDAHQAWGHAVDWEQWRDPLGNPDELSLLPEGVEFLRRACGRCEACTPEVEATRDVQLVHGIRSVQRTRCYQHGVRSIDDLAALTSPIQGMNPRVQERLVRQASAQVGQLNRIAQLTDAGGQVGTGMRAVTGTGEPLALEQPELSAEVEPIVRADLINPDVVQGLPQPSPGDVYFDFEGDPMWTRSGGLEGGLEYLFGLIEEGDDEDYVAFWAHNREQEKQALVDFLDYINRRRARYPDMRIYHYANYEQSALERLAERHGIGLDEVLSLIREGVLVDLFPVVRNCVVVSQPSYSIKALEPLYMGAELRDQDGVTSGGASVVEYARAMTARADGRDTDAAAILEEIADYNRYDCVSTRRLVQWLRALAQMAGPSVGGSSGGDAGASRHDPQPPVVDPPQPLAPTGKRRLEQLLRDAAGPPPRTADQEALALLSAAIDFQRREAAPAWREHFERLSHPVDWWADNRDVLIVDADGSAPEVLSDWEGSTRTKARILRLSGSLGAGSTPKAEQDVFCLYPLAESAGLTSTPGAAYATTYARIKAVETAKDGARGTFEVRETAPPAFADGPHSTAVPIAVAPGGPIPAKSAGRILCTIAGQVAGISAEQLDGLPREATNPAISPHLGPDPALDLLRRLPPRLDGDQQLPTATDRDLIATVTEATSRLQQSYLAIQGPPGTGKTYLGARVISSLVRDRGWRIGVVAQSHAVVENLLDEVVAAGLPGDLVAKKPNTALDLSNPEVVPPPWTMLGADEHADFLADHAESGCVVGGTMWDLTSRRRFAPRQLDLLVIDEAGQFSLANTIATSASAKRLLLLGDPQQLPQVSQGSHPEPVDISALAWLTDGAATLPADRGYFIEKSWRMTSALCRAVSDLSYDGKLQSQTDVTDQRRLDGMPPGVRLRAVHHRGNSTSSREEARVVLDLVTSVIGQSWVPGPGEDPRPAEARDVLVVAPYNAQVNLVRETLDAAGYQGVRVGTVDKFQGQQAAVAIVTLAASSARDAPRGLGFLLNRNRLNVAISRAQWSAIVVHSAALADSVPHEGSALADLGAFLRLGSA